MFLFLLFAANQQSESGFSIYSCVRPLASVISDSVASFGAGSAKHCYMDYVDLGSQKHIDTQGFFDNGPAEEKSLFHGFRQCQEIFNTKDKKKADLAWRIITTSYARRPAYNVRTNNCCSAAFESIEDLRAQGFEAPTRDELLVGQVNSGKGTTYKCPQITHEDIHPK